MVPSRPKVRVNPHPIDLTGVGKTSEEYPINPEKNIVLKNFMMITRIIINIS